MPQIIQEETVNKFREELTKKVNQCRNDISSLTNLVGDGPALVLPQDFVEVSVEKYSRELAEKLSKAQVEYRAYPQTSHHIVARRALAHRKPFDANGRVGYRDTLIWESILEIAKESDGEQIVFITGNSEDFGKSNQLHPDLIADLQGISKPADHV